MGIFIKHPGVHATIQDLGRVGLQKYGVVVGGAMDSVALRVGNLLVGNDEGEAGVEVMHYGTSFTFLKDHVISITGAHLQPMIDGTPVDMWKPLFVQQDSTLTFKGSAHGCFAYIAVAGGFDIPLELGSKSTYTRARIGGVEGRALKKGDVLATEELSVHQYHRLTRLKNKLMDAHWFANAREIYGTSTTPVIRMLKGSEYDSFTEESKEAFTSSTYTRSMVADRMGYTFSGPLLERKHDVELVSEGVTYGTVQVPVSGKPIILMADRQTTGGYPKIGQVISADLPKLSQLHGGSEVTFSFITTFEAEQELFNVEKYIQEMAVGIDLKMKAQ